MKLFNSLFIKAFAARSSEADPSLKYMFEVTFGTTKMSFQKVGGLSTESEVIEYFENGYDYAHKLPGRTKFNEITFSKGMFEDTDMLADFKRSSTWTNFGTTRFDTQISILNRYGQVIKTYNLSNCWFSKYEFDELDASSSDVLIETLTMQYEYLV